jgi:hypothetical protein
LKERKRGREKERKREREKERNREREKERKREREKQRKREREKEKKREREKERDSYISNKCLCKAFCEEQARASSRRLARLFQFFEITFETVLCTYFQKLERQTGLFPQKYLPIFVRFF